MKNKYIIGFLLFIIFLLGYFILNQYLEFKDIKSESSYETYNMLTIAIQSLSYYEKAWQKGGVDGLMLQLNDYSKENGINYFRNVLKYLEKNKKNLHGIAVQDSNAFIIYSIGPDGINDSLKKGTSDYSTIEFFDYIIKKEGDIIVTYFVDYKE